MKKRLKSAACQHLLLLVRHDPPEAAIQSELFVYGEFLSQILHIELVATERDEQMLEGTVCLNSQGHLKCFYNLNSNYGSSKPKSGENQKLH